MAALVDQIKFAIDKYLKISNAAIIRAGKPSLTSLAEMGSEQRLGFCARIFQQGKDYPLQKDAAEAFKKIADDVKPQLETFNPIVDRQNFEKAVTILKSVVNVLQDEKEFITLLDHVDPAKKLSAQDAAAVMRSFNRSMLLKAMGDQTASNQGASNQSDKQRFLMMMAEKYENDKSIADYLTEVTAKFKDRVDKNVLKQLLEACLDANNKTSIYINIQNVLKSKDYLQLGDEGKKYLQATLADKVINKLADEKNSPIKSAKLNDIAKYLNEVLIKSSDEAEVKRVLSMANGLLVACNNDKKLQIDHMNILFPNLEQNEYEKALTDLQQNPRKIEEIFLRLHQNNIGSIRLEATIKTLNDFKPGQSLLNKFKSAVGVDNEVTRNKKLKAEKLNEKISALNQIVKNDNASVQDKLLAANNLFLLIQEMKNEKNTKDQKGNEMSAAVYKDKFDDVFKTVLASEARLATLIKDLQAKTEVKVDQAVALQKIGSVQTRPRH